MTNEWEYYCLFRERHFALREYFCNYATKEYKDDPMMYVWPVSYESNVMVFCNLEDNNLWIFTFKNDLTVKQWSMFTLKRAYSQKHYINTVAQQRLQTFLYKIYCEGEGIPYWTHLDYLYRGCIGDRLFFYKPICTHKDYDGKIGGCYLIRDFSKSDSRPHCTQWTFKPRSKG